MSAEISSSEAALARRAALHGALADPHRLAIVDSLALSDRTPGELGRELGLPSNLLTHHLDVLERQGLVARMRSLGDGRRRYVRLAAGVLDDLLPRPLLPARTVLFVCHHNAARSQLARALWAAVSPIPADCAGPVPATRVHPGAVAVAERHGLDLTGARPKGYESVQGAADLLISVCDLVRETNLPPARLHLHWSVPDPVTRGDEGSFESAFAELARRVAATAPRFRTMD